jgi:hypothetical protein
MGIDLGRKAPVPEPVPQGASSETDTTPAPGATHVALCIGNSKYASPYHPLKNAGNDAQDMAALCTKLGFATELVLDASKSDMILAVEAFAQKCKGADTSLFFFSGVLQVPLLTLSTILPAHSLDAPFARKPGFSASYEGQSFMLPVDIVAKDASTEDDRLAELPSTALRVQHVVDRCQPSRLGLFIMDADSCPGKVALWEIPSIGKLVAGAGEMALDGNGRNGLFTEHLLQHLGRPSEDLAFLFGFICDGVKKETKGKQIPMMSCALARDPARVGGNVYLVEPASEAGPSSGSVAANEVARLTL